MACGLRKGNWEKVAFLRAQMWSDMCTPPTPHHPGVTVRKAKGEGSWGRGAQVVCWQNVRFPPQINALSLL